MRLAAIDCGTHSIRLLISDFDPARPQTPPVEVLRLTRIVGLGAGVDGTGHLAADALARTLQAVEDYAQRIRQAEVDRVRMVATSASRDADNFIEFATGVEARLGVAPEVISGQEEASLGFSGAAGTHPGIASPTLVVDIGGGSTEFSFGTTSSDAEAAAGFPADPEGSTAVNAPVSAGKPAGKLAGKPAGELSAAGSGSGETSEAFPSRLARTVLQAAVSMNMGSTRVTERYLRPSEDSRGVPSREALAQAKGFVDTMIAQAWQSVPLDQARSLIGVAGSVTTLTAWALGLETYDRRRINGAVLPSARLRELADELMVMPRSRKAAIGPMHPKRVDQIAGGVLVWERVLAFLESQPLPGSLEGGTPRGSFPVLTSEYDILDGVILAMAHSLE